MPTLLLVDDDPGVRRVVREMLRRADYVVREAADGRQALEAIVAALPDVIVLDVVLPHVSGLEVLDRLRATGLAPGVPVITMTGSIVPDAVMRAKGARGVLRKPFSVRELRDAIEAATGTTAA